MSNRYDDDDFDRNIMDRNVSSRRLRSNINERDVNDYGQRSLTNRSDFTGSRYGNQSRYFNDEPISGYSDDYARDTEINRSNRQSFNQPYNRERELGRYSQNINRENDYGRSGYGYNQGFNQDYGRSYRQDMRQDYGQSYGQGSGQYYGQTYSHHGHDMRDVGNVGDVDRGYSGYRRDFEDRSPDYSREYQNFGGRDLSRDYSSRSSNINRNVGPHIGRGPKGYQRSDERIREEICEILWRHDMIDASDIDVNVVNGEVTLTGTVESRLTKRLAEDILEDINGVRDVHNQLKVNREDRFSQQYNTQSNLSGTPTTSTQTREQTVTDNTNLNTQSRATGAK